MSEQICASIAEATTEAVLARAREVAPWCGLIEVRIDAAPPGALDPAVIIGASPRPVLATCRPVREGGAWTGDEAPRLALLAAWANAGARWLDVEWDAVGELPELRPGVQLLVSRHTQPAADPAAVATRSAPAPGRAERGHAREGELRIPAKVDPHRAAFERRVEPLLRSTWHLRADLRKVALPVSSAEEALWLLERAAVQVPPVIAVPLGPAGVVGRLAGARWAAPWSYAAADPGKPTGAGQLAARDLAALLRGRKVTASTALLGVLGKPVTHSRSPAVMNAAFEALGVDAVFSWLESADPAALLDALDRDGTLGVSVTIPHKTAAAAWLAARGGAASEAVRATGALNTLVRRPGGAWSAESTDALAALDLLRAAGVGTGRSVSVVGAGGAARAVTWAAARLGARVRLFGRDPAAGQAVVGRLAPTGDVGWGGPLQEVPPAARAPEQVVVNATSVGMGTDPHAPVPADVHGPGTVAYDLVYTPEETPFLRQARARGARPITGVDHFVRQARGQLGLWLGADRAAKLDDDWLATRARGAS